MAVDLPEPLLSLAQSARVLSAPGLWPFHEELESAVFRWQDVLARQADDFESQARGRLGVNLAGVPRVAPEFLDGVELPTVPESIIVAELHWPTWADDGSPMRPFLGDLSHGFSAPIDAHEIDYLAELDRDAGVVQLFGRILDLGEIRIAFGEDGGLPRITGSIVIENVDGWLTPRLRGGSLLQLRIVFRYGWRSWPWWLWRQVCPPMKVDKIGALTTTSVDLSLIDAHEDSWGGVVRLAKLRDLADVELLSSETHRRAVTGNSQTAWLGYGNGQQPTIGGLRATGAINAQVPAGYDPARSASVGSAADLGISTDETRREKRIGVPFGRLDYVKPSMCWVGYGQNPQAVIVLGASRSGTWQRRRYWMDCDSASGQSVQDFELYIREGTSMVPIAGYHTTGALTHVSKAKGFTGYVEIHQVEAEQLDRPFPTDTWYVAVLYLVIGWTEFNAQTLEYQMEVRGALARLQAAAADDEVYWRPAGVGGGAEGSGQADKHDPVTIVEEILGKYSNADWSAFDLATFTEAKEAAGVRGNFACCGVLDEEKPAREYVEAIAKTWGLDFHQTREGKVAMRTRGLTAKDIAERIPRAKEFSDSFDLQEGTWSERIPTGDERWGVANAFKLEGLKPTTLAIWPRLAESPYQYRTELLGDRIIERPLETSWRRQSEPNVRWIEALAEPWTVTRFVAAFETHLAALSRWLGDFLLVTHWAGSIDGGRGWESRLAQIQTIILKLKQRRVGLEVLDREPDHAGIFPAILDSRSLWTQFRPRSPQSIDTTAGVAAVVCNAWGPESEGVAPNHALWTPRGAYLVDYWHTISNVTPTGFDVSPVPTQTEHLTDFVIKRTHVMPPTDAREPGRYPNGSDMYARLCERASGTFSNDDPGYKLREG
ncbi:MAG: hypothetical protein Q8Q14_10765 [Gemmatimonadales bacterium]|nr:hypothetical protein [Gemmatimonadales bacterium]